MELKTYISLKEVDKKHQLKEDYVVVSSDRKSVKVHDPYQGQAGLSRIHQQKPDQEFNFKCDQVVLGAESKKDKSFFKVVAEEMVQQAIMNQKNGIIILHGQTKGGKSSILFGDEKNKNRGILEKSIQKIFDSVHTNSTSSLGKNQTPYHIYLSMFDINAEFVRDFGMYFYTQNQQSWNNQDYNFSNIQKNTLAKQSPELLENSNDVIQVRGLTKLEIKSVEQFQKLLKDEEHFRTNLDQRHSISSKRYNQIYVITLTHKSSQQSSYLYFVKLSGSEKIMKQPNQNQEEKRAQDQLLANNQLYSLAKYIGNLAKNEPAVYHDNILTKALFSILSGAQKPSLVSVCAQIYPVEQNYEESLITLQYHDKFKAYDASYKKTVFDGPMPELIAAQERLLSRIIDENKYLKSRLQQAEKEENDKFEDIRRRLGLEYPIQSLLKAKQHSKEHQHILLHQEANLRSNTLQKYNQELEKKFKTKQNQYDESEKELFRFQEKCDQQIEQVERQYRELENQYQYVQNRIKDQNEQDSRDVCDELGRMLEHGHVLMEEKANLIHGIKGELKRTTEHFNRMNEMKEMGKKEAEFKYKSILNDKQQEFKDRMKKEKYEYLEIIEDRDKQFQQFNKECNEYVNQKKETIKNARNEIVHLFQIARQQNLTIQKVEDGAYNNGIKSYNIPKSEKVNLPDRENYKFLYKSLEQTKTLMSVKNSRTDQMYIKQQQMEKDMKDLTLEDSYAKELQRINESYNQSQNQKVSYSKYDETQEKEKVQDFNSFRNTQERDINLMPLDGLKTFIKACQQEIQRCENSKPLNTIGLRGETLQELLQERDQYKQMYVQENKKYVDSQEILESQKRLIDKSQKAIVPNNGVQPPAPEGAQRSRQQYKPTHLNTESIISATKPALSGSSRPQTQQNLSQRR